MQESVQFDPRTHARKRDPDTSKQASKGAANFADSHAGRIHAALKAWGPTGATTIAAQTGLTQVQVCRRLPDLKNAGLAETTGRDCWFKDGRLEREWRVRRWIP